MIHIAICDDINEICSQIEHYLISIAHVMNVGISTEVYYSGEKLCEDLSNSISYDLIFLDIQLENLSGLGVGYFIRETLKDDFTQIAYISGNTDYALELFDIHPINFLVKPVTKNGIEKIFKKFLKINNLWSETFSYKYYHDTKNVNINNIIYFIKNARKVKIFFNDGTQDEFYGSLDDISIQLKKYNFIYTHKSYLVNYSYVSVVQSDILILKNNVSIPISQSKRKDVREQIFNIEVR